VNVPLPENFPPAPLELEGMESELKNHQKKASSWR